MQPCLQGGEPGYADELDYGDLVERDRVRWDYHHLYEIDDTDVDGEDAGEGAGGSN